MLSIQSISYSSVVKTQIEKFSTCAKFKKHPESEHFKNYYCFVFENGMFNFREIFCMRVLNLENLIKLRKSQNLILPKISKNKIISE